MTNEPRSPEEIEREIEAQRSELSNTLGDLQDKFSIDTLVRQVRDQFGEHGGDIGRSALAQAKANPIPLALTAVGLGWLMLGGGGPSAASIGRQLPNSGDRTPEFRGDRRPVSGTGPDDGPDWARYERDDPPGMAFGNIEEAESSTGSSRIKDGAQGLRDRADVMTSRLSQGTEDFSEEARQRVVAARQKAVDMREKALRSASQGTDAAADLYDRQPLVVGALALAVGSALAGSLPRTKTEDDLMGGHSDALIAEADRVFAEEKERAIAVAKSVGDEVKNIAAETKADLDAKAPGDKDAVEAGAKKAKTAASRVVKTAKSTAKDKPAVKPKS